MDPASRKLERSESSKSVLNEHIVSHNTAHTITANTKRRTSMFDPIDPLELQKTLYQNQQNVCCLMFF